MGAAATPYLRQEAQWYRWQLLALPGAGYGPVESQEIAVCTERVQPPSGGAQTA